MHRDNIRIYRTSTNVLLTQRDVPVEYIEWVQLLPAGLTIYKRVPLVRLEQVERDSLSAPTASLSGASASGYV